jgi:hypothetical protein
MKRWDMVSMMPAAMKNRILEMTKGCAIVSPDLVATDAEAQSAAKASPVNMKPVLLSAICAFK